MNLDFASIKEMSTLVYYTGMILVVVFMFGFLLSNRVKAIWKESAEIMENNIKELNVRVGVLEKSTITKEDHEKDINHIETMMEDIKLEIRQGIQGVATRIDTLQNTLVLRSKAD